MTATNFASLANHLWQSTFFALAAALLNWMFRKQRAQVRYCVWLAASVKFLAPFALLISIGSQVRWSHSTSVVPAQVPIAVNQISRPFISAAGAPTTPSISPVPTILVGVWACGVAVVLLSWFLRWRRVRAAVRAAVPLSMNLPVPVMVCPAAIEPGVFGIFKPVLLLPQDILKHLPPEQLRAILAHELCHVRRSDNLAAVVHMAVEAIFWFHPLVWWIGSRLVEERERACDEEVLRTAEPGVYAEGILNVCKFCLVSPLPCVSGVTGSDLRRRIEQIMTLRATSKLGAGKKLLLAFAAILAVGLPIAIGMIDAPRVRAQAREAFDVASVKENHSSDFRSGGTQFLPGGRYRAVNTPLYWIIAEAYNIPPGSVRISGGRNWIGEERFDIEASAAAGSVPQNLSVKAREDKMKLMLQSLLADRFKLVMQHESKEMPVYAVVAGKNGVKLTKAKIDEKDCSAGPPSEASCHIINGGMGRGMHGKAVEVADIVAFVENWSDRPVVDKTGLTGLYEVETEGWSPMRPRPRPPGTEPSAEDTAFADPARPTLFMIFERLGLKMESAKAQVDAYFIDHVERPSAN